MGRKPRPASYNPWIKLSWFMVNSYFYQLVPSQLVLFFGQLILFGNSYFGQLVLFLWSTCTFFFQLVLFKTYLQYAMLLYYDTPWTFKYNSFRTHTSQICVRSKLVIAYFGIFHALASKIVIRPSIKNFWFAITRPTHQFTPLPKFFLMEISDMNFFYWYCNLMKNKILFYSNIIKQPLNIFLITLITCNNVYNIHIVINLQS